MLGKHSAPELHHADLNGLCSRKAPAVVAVTGLRGGTCRLMTYGLFNIIVRENATFLPHTR